jgi:SUN domain-containing protein 1/2
MEFARAPSPFAPPAAAEAKPPELALRRGAAQGNCWPLAGTKGALEVELANDVVPSAITLVHIHPKLAPKGDVSSAPKDFVVYGYPRGLSATAAAAAPALGNDAETAGHAAGDSARAAAGGKVELVRGRFDGSAGCMTFPVPRHRAVAVRRVELQVLSNHGRPELTCVYRFMVHGDPAPKRHAALLAEAEE